MSTVDKAIAEKSDLKTLDLATEHLFDMVVHLEQPMEVGNIPKGNRQILIGKGGEFNGKRLRGEILPHGADWYLTRPDGVGELDVRVTLRTDDGALIYMQSDGFLRYSMDVAKRLLSGVAEPHEYYLREKTSFETAAEKYGWLNSIVAVGTGWYGNAMVGMSIYEIK
ncbi:MAG: DUF3237 domain-containing protein [Pseudomonadales bacterium]|nr:DUF3237 domain-containing protein [Pseudomonadales bacterium]